MAYIIFCPVIEVMHTFFIKAYICFNVTMSGVVIQSRAIIYYIPVMMTIESTLYLTFIIILAYVKHTLAWSSWIPCFIIIVTIVYSFCTTRAWIFLIRYYFKSPVKASIHWVAVRHAANCRKPSNIWIIL